MKITNINENKFEVTNGYDVIVCERRDESLPRHPSWDPRYPVWDLATEVESGPICAPKEEVLAEAVRLLTEPLGCAMSREAAEEMQELYGTVHGIVSVTLSELVNTSPLEIPDMVDGRLCEAMLGEEKYAVVAVSEDGQTLNLRVEGRL